MWVGGPYERVEVVEEGGTQVPGGGGKVAGGPAEGDGGGEHGPEREEGDGDEGPRLVPPLPEQRRLCAPAGGDRNGDLSRRRRRGWVDAVVLVAGDGLHCSTPAGPDPRM